MFEKGNFAGVEEMKKNERLFNRVAPMGVNDILMAVQYVHQERPPLRMPMVSFEGLLDYTIDPNNMAQWEQYCSSNYRNTTLMGDHYFVSTHYQQVSLLALSHDIHHSVGNVADAVATLVSYVLASLWPPNLSAQDNNNPQD